MNTANLRRLAGERFVQLLLGRAPTDTRSADQLRREAARQILHENRGQGSTGKASSTGSGGFEILFARVWQICCNMAAHADMRRSSSEHSEELQITPDANPIIADEQFPNIRKSPDDTAVTLPVFSNGGVKQLIPDHEFPRFGMADEVSNNWRQSILENQERAKQRDIASARHRSQQANTRYVG
jgi:hypothetical protein